MTTLSQLIDPNFLEVRVRPSQDDLDAICDIEIIDIKQCRLFSNDDRLNLKFKVTVLVLSGPFIGKTIAGFLSIQKLQEFDTALGDNKVVTVKNAFAWVLEKEEIWISRRIEFLPKTA